MSNLERRLFQLMIFLIPSNLAYHWYTNESFINGFLVDYLVPKLYLSDLPIVALLLMWIWKFVPPTSPHKAVVGIYTFCRRHVILLFLLGYLLTTSLFSARPLAALWFWVKLLEMILIAFYLVSHYSWSTFYTSIRFPLLLTLSFQSILSLLQYFRQRSFIGYILLGEPNLVDSFSIAKDAFSGALKILPYGTTPHPNVLAGFIGSGVLLLSISSIVFPKKRHNLIPHLITICLSMWVLWLSRSQTALFSLLISISIFIIYHLWNRSRKFVGISLAKFITLSVMLLFTLIVYHSDISFDNASIERRYRLLHTSFDLFKSHPIIGTGLNQFIPASLPLDLITTPAPFLQPVHSIYLLWLSETGLLGTVVLIWILFKHRKTVQIRRFCGLALPLINILFIGLFDHYPLTLQPGQLLLTLCLSLLFLK